MTTITEHGERRTLHTMTALPPQPVHITIWSEMQGGAIIGGAVIDAYETCSIAEAEAEAVRRSGHILRRPGRYNEQAGRIEISLWAPKDGAAPKRPRGKGIPGGKPHTIYAGEDLIKAATELGGGNISGGLRQAFENLGLVQPLP